jgi:nucleoside-diphosphate-sugar epimerase
MCTGAGGKGGASRTYAVDRDAARHFITASARTPSVKTFLMVSWIGSRRQRAPWWTDADEQASQKVWNEILPDYAKAKLDADECLVAMAAQRKDWRAICLRPGSLKDDAAKGKVLLGRTPARGEVTRADVADVAVRLLESEHARGYYDLLNGEEDVGDAVNRVVREKVDCIEGEDVQEIVEKYKL